MTHRITIGTLLIGALLINLPVQLKAQSKDPYKNLWEEVAQFKKDGKSTSALEKSLEIKIKAEKEKKDDERIKALIHIMYFSGLKEEDAFIHSLENMEVEIQKAQEPSRSILHSALAEMYSWYFESNKWKVLQRSIGTDENEKDITTWGAKRLVLKIDEHYSASLSKADFLKKTKPGEFDIIWEKGIEGRLYQPSLFDILAHRALEFYEHTNSGLTLPRDQFNIDESTYFSDSEDFVQIKNKEIGYLSFDLKVIEIYQSLMIFHMAQKNLDALAYNDLSRLSFVYNRYKNADRDKLYEDALSQIIQTYSTSDISTDAQYNLAEMYYNSGKTYHAFENPSVRWDIEKSIKVCDRAIKSRPNSLGADRCKALKINIMEPGLLINMESIVYPEEAFLMSLNYRNVNKVYFRIFNLKEQILVKEADRNLNQSLQYFIDKKAIREWSVEIPDSGDFQYHRIELPMEKLNPGFYALVSSTDPSFKTNNNVFTSNTFWVSNMAYFFTQEKDGSAKIFVTNRKSGLPLKGVKADIYHQTYNYEKRGNELKEYDVKSSDASGKILIQGQQKPNGFKVLLSKGKDSLMINSLVYIRGDGNKDEREFFQTSIFTDRAVYRPGQTVYFKGILVKSKGFEYDLVHDKKVIVKLFDAYNQEVSRMELSSSEYGSFTGSFPLPSSALTGRFYLDDGSSRHTILVEEYKRPSFEVTSNEVEGNYKLGDEISISGEAISLNGVPLTNAKGSFHVTRGWANITPYYSIRMPYYSNKTEISQGSFVVDDKGHFEFTFEATPDKNVAEKERPIFHYQIELMVTDVNGESQEQKRSLRVGYHSMVVGMDLSGEMSKERLAQTEIWTRNLMGVFTPAEVRAEIIALIPPTALHKKRLWDKPDYYQMSQNEFEQQFPMDDYSDESEMLQWKSGEKILEKTIFTQKGKNALLQDLNKLESGAYEIRFSSTDPFGQPVSWIGRTMIYDEKETTLSSPQNLWTKISDNKVQVGQALTLKIGSSLKKGAVLYNISNKNGLILESWLDVKGGIQTINYTVNQADRGDLVIEVVLISEGRIYFEKHIVQVPLDHKELSLKLETTRKDLKPGELETWKIAVLDKANNPVKAEILASMYDASLDVIQPNQWWFNPFDWGTWPIYWNTGNNFEPSYSQFYPYFNREEVNIRSRKFDALNWFEFSYQSGRLYELRSFAQTMDADAVGQAESKSVSKNEAVEVLEIEDETEEEEVQANEDRIRTDFRETAFFFPELTSDEMGNSEFSFQVPDALTKWKLQVLAHSASLQYGMLKDEFVTKKELMVVPNYPRFLSEGDTIIFSAKVSNLLDKEMEVKVRISLSNPATGQPIKGLLLSKETHLVAIAPGQSEVVHWKFISPEKLGLLEIGAMADSKNHMDGESRTIPVLSKSILITETYPISVRAGVEKKVKVKMLEKAQSSIGIEPKRLTLEVTPNPSWYVVQALPYLAEIGNESTEQLFNRYYANRLAFFITASNEQIQKIFNIWKESSPETFRSKLEQNAELKNIVLSETPWLLEAKSEEEDKRKIALFFDQNNMRNNLNTALFELLQSQSPNGGWPWFKGMEDNRFVTQHIVIGMGRINHLIGLNNEENSLQRESQLWNKILKAISYLDARMDEEYRRIVSSSGSKENTFISAHQIQYLFARSYFSEIPLQEKHKEAYDYFKDQNKKYWLNSSKYLQAMTALTFHRLGDIEFAKKILTSLRENAIQSEEFGMYWKKETAYAWYLADVEQQAMIIEAFEEIENDLNAVEEMKIYLLKQKQTHRWRTGKATAEACYALLMRGDDLISASNKMSASVGKEQFEFPVEGSSEAGTSYTKMNWSGSEIKPEMKDVSFKNEGSSIAWGALYFQYFQSSDAVEEANTGLSISRDLYVKRYNNEGPYLKLIDQSVHLETGEVVVVKLTVKSDRDLEFVHLKDMKAAGLEPFDANSGYRYSDGIGYYLSIRDAATHFYFNRLNRGTHVLEYELKANNSGNFSTGISTIQSFYAPEFSAHSNGGRIEIE